MASTNHTSNYNLPQWEATDPFKREDFNDAFSKIDTEIKDAKDAVSQIECCNVMVGTYTGNGSNRQTITLGITPKAVLTMQDGWRLDDSGTCYGGMAITGQNCSTVAITDGGFNAIQSGNYYYGNANGQRYTYIAFY